jgi:23S rRNA (cytosine1962-C5)-methyltransferase
MRELPTIVLREGRDRSVRAGHPWLLSGSVDRVEGAPASGDPVRVASAAGEVLAYGDYDPDSQIRIRLHTRGATDPGPDEPWLEARLEAALDWRAAHPSLRNTDALRLVHAEADGLPGLTVDRYARWGALRATTAAMARRVERVAGILSRRPDVEGVWLRGGAPAQKARPASEVETPHARRPPEAEAGPAQHARPAPETGAGQSQQTPEADGRAQGAPETGAESTGHAPPRLLAGSVPDEPLAIEERGRRYWVDVRRGQKTGFYLDQREARDLFARLAAGRRALDLYAYTGGFALAALRGGAREVVAVESSKAALDLLARNAPDATAIHGDVPEFLRREASRFDLIAVDPPPFARRKRDVQAAARAYKDLFLWALRRAAPGAEVLVFSCSHHVSADLLRKVVFAAVSDGGAEAQVLGALGAPPDHPVDVRHPEGEYLKGLWLRVAKPAD